MMLAKNILLWDQFQSWKSAYGDVQFISVVPSYLTGVLLVFVLELQLEKETLLFECTERAR